jgi:hypothetical protein
MHRQKGSRKEPDLPWLAPRPICHSASHHIRLGTRLMQDNHSESDLRTACANTRRRQITESSTSATRQAEIDYHSRKIARRRMSDNSRLSDMPELHHRPGAKNPVLNPPPSHRAKLEINYGRGGKGYVFGPFRFVAYPHTQ